MQIIFYLNQSYQLIILFTLLIPYAVLLRCKCSTNKGAAPCNGYYCDVHGKGTKRAACGAVRISKQTHFACVLIKQSSNDTFCHVVRSATACWCRNVDFCNVDLERELFDVDEEHNEDYQPSSTELSGDDIFVIKANRFENSKSIERRINKNQDSIRKPDISESRNFNSFFTNLGETIPQQQRPDANKNEERKSAIRMDLIETIKITPSPKESIVTFVEEQIHDESTDDELAISLFIPFLINILDKFNKLKSKISEKNLRNLCISNEFFIFLSKIIYKQMFEYFSFNSFHFISSKMFTVILFNANLVILF